jgi:flagellar basal body rod protein FlgG
MIRGLYTAAAGMISGLLRHESIIQNLSNVRTVGYKADRATVTDFPSLLLTQVYQDNSAKEIGRAGTGVSMSDVVTNFDDGPLKLTDHPLDFAVAGEGFFRVQTEDGVLYTRDGRFHRDSDGQLVNANGYRVLGANGPLTLPNGLLTVSPTGEVFVDEALVGQLNLATFEDMDDVIKVNETMFSGREGVEPEILAAADTKIYQGYLEDSNVDTTQAITEIMSVLRNYEASQRLLRYQDQINEKTVSQLGSV